MYLNLETVQLQTDHRRSARNPDLQINTGVSAGQSLQRVSNLEENVAISCQIVQNPNVDESNCMSSCRQHTF